MNITKAIIPAAGLGTRFLPATKSTPKEMLPIFNKPAIQHVVEEGVKSGIKNFTIVTSKAKKTIEDHFDLNLELEYKLQEKKMLSYISSLSKVLKAASFSYVRQGEPLGLGHAIWKARHNIGKEYVSIFLPDDIIDSNIPGMAQLIKVATLEKCSVIAVREVPEDQISNYGVIQVRKQFSPNLFQIKELVEKPNKTNAPSNLAIFGRYVLSSKIFESLDELKTGSNGEMQLTDAIQNMILSGEKVFAYRIQGDKYDIGRPLGLLKASINFALKHPDYRDEIKEYLLKIDKDFIIMQGQLEQLNKNKRAVL